MFATWYDSSSGASCRKGYDRLGRTRICHADSSAEFRRLFAQAAAQAESLLLCGSTADGREAERLVRELQPDIVVMSLTLQFVDGMELIARIKRLPNAPRILVVSYLVRDFCIEEAMRLGADYFMLKPCTLSLVLERAQELASAGAKACSGAAVPGIAAPGPLVQALISRMGIAPELSGFRYTAEAVRITLLHGEIGITKELYPQIAETFHVTVPAVERAIRHAIDTAWKRPASHARRQLFPGRDRPSNSRFIARIAGACETSQLESDWLGEL